MHSVSWTTHSTNYNHKELELDTLLAQPIWPSSSFNHKMDTKRKAASMVYTVTVKALVLV
jgi:hypothetical protein